MDEPELVAGLVQRASVELNICLQPGGDVRRARLLLRFAAALVATNVVHAVSLMAAVRSLVDTALGIAEASEWGSSRDRARAAAISANSPCPTGSHQWRRPAGARLLLLVHDMSHVPFL